MAATKCRSRNALDTASRSHEATGFSSRRDAAT